MESRYLKGKNKTPRDPEYISAYLKTHSQTKAAALCGVSRETIARAVRRADIPLTGRKYNDGQKNGQLKITDEELKREALLLNASQIAKKYNIDLVNVYRRGKRLGLDLKCDSNTWKKRCNRYGINKFDKTITLKKVIKKYNGICQICGKPIDENDIKDGHIRKNYPTVDHIKPISKGGTHTWDNIQLAHMACNAGKCDKYVINE